MPFASWPCRVASLAVRASRRQCTCRRCPSASFRPALPSAPSLSAHALRDAPFAHLRISRAFLPAADVLSLSAHVLSLARSLARSLSLSLSLSLFPSLSGRARFTRPCSRSLCVFASLPPFRPSFPPSLPQSFPPSHLSLARRLANSIPWLLRMHQSIQWVH